MPTLRQILEHEFGTTSFLKYAPGEHLSSSVTQVYLSNGAPCSSHASPFQDWPGSEDDVMRWFQLENGTAAGLRGPFDAPQSLAFWGNFICNDIDWNRLRTFKVVTEVGSFTKAGHELDLSQSAVSRQIAALERQIGATLFIRGSGGLVLTEAGEFFLDTVAKMSQNLMLGQARLNEIRTSPTGPLRITTTVGFGSAWLTSRINKFHTAYPDIQVSLLLVDDSELDLRNREADCAIRFQMPSEPDLIQRYVDSFVYKIYASRDYLAKHGTPATLSDLSEHDLIVYGEGVGTKPIEQINWLLSEGMPEGELRVPALRVNSVYGIFRAVESGMGIAALPFYMADESDQLSEVFADIEGPRIPVYFVYPVELRPSRRIDVLRDFLLREIRQSWSDHQPDDSS
jgi:DNA-binding transcriptional LysR family regulator